MSRVLLRTSLGFDFVMTISPRRAAGRLSLGLQHIAAAAQHCWFGDGSGVVAGSRADAPPGASTPAGPCGGRRRTGDAARLSASDPGTCPERSDAEKQND